MTVVALACPFQRSTVTFGINPVPVAISVNPALPATACNGEILVSVGTGFGVTTVNGTVFEVPPPGVGLNTVMFATVAAVRSDAGIVTIS